MSVTTVLSILCGLLIVLCIVLVAMLQEAVKEGRSWKKEFEYEREGNLEIESNYEQDFLTFQDNEWRHQRMVEHLFKRIKDAVAGQDSAIDCVMTFEEANDALTDIEAELDVISKMDVPKRE